MCSSGRMCGGGEPLGSSGGSVSRSGSQYALCALGVGLVALGIVMIVWTVVPQDGQGLGLGGNSSEATTVPADDEAASDAVRTSSVAYVLVGSGAAILLLSLCLGVRNKRRESRGAGEPGATGAVYLDHVAGEQGVSEEAGPTYDVPSYLEAVGSGQYPVSQSNLRHSTSQLPSYEDLISAVENEGAGPSPASIEEAPPTPAAAADAAAALEPQPAPGPASTSLLTRSTSRVSRILRPLRVRRIKSEKLHLKDFRLKIRTPTENPVTIEPITPPPQYDDKEPEF